MSSPPQTSSPRDDPPPPAVPGGAAGAWREVVGVGTSPRLRSSISPTARGLSRDPPPPRGGTGGLGAPTPPARSASPPEAPKREMGSPGGEEGEMKLVTHSFHGYPLTNPIQVLLLLLYSRYRS